MSNDDKPAYIPPHKRRMMNDVDKSDNQGGGRGGGRGGGTTRMGREFPMDNGPSYFNRNQQNDTDGDQPTAPAMPKRAGLLDIGPTATRRRNFNDSPPQPGSSNGPAEHEDKPVFLGGRGGKSIALDQDGNPIDTVLRWKTKGGRKVDPDFDIEAASIETFGPVGKKKGHGGSGINFDTFFDIPVSLTGENFEAVEEIPCFSEAGSFIHPALLENIGRIGYDKPTPVQKWSIPCVLAGRDLMACAQTGSGKTAAFLFPIISKMLNDGPIGKPTRGTSRQQRPTALVLSPTRELATQIYDEAKKFCFNTGIRPVVVYGGQPFRDQYFDISQGCDVCIATPGRLIDHVTRKNGSICLSECYYFVLDEADRMLDMGFSSQITEIVDMCQLPGKNHRQTIMFSATFPNPIQKLAEDFMADYLFLTVGRVGSTNECIEQIVLYADERAKPTRLIGLLNDISGLTLIFVDTKKKADQIHEYLQRQDIGSVSIHGDRSQAEREEALDAFRTGQVSVMVATDVVGRGLDIPNVTHVINHDMPPTIDDYVHRIGRTGRAGNKGRASTFITEQNGSVLRDLINVLKEAKQDIPKWLLEMVSSGVSITRGGRGGARGRGGMTGGRTESAYGMAVGGAGRRAPGMAVDVRYQGAYQGGAAVGAAYRPVKKESDDVYDGW